MAKFKSGDEIKCIIPGRGFESATVLDICTEKVSKDSFRKMYLLKIMCGTATIPIEAEENYQLKKAKKQ